jgi:hypothetical protein
VATRAPSIQQAALHYSYHSLTNPILTILALIYLSHSLRWCMTSTVTLTAAYLRAVQTDLRRFLTTLNTRLEQLEAAQAEIYDAQTWLLENRAPMFILANQNTAVT